MKEPNRVSQLSCRRVATLDVVRIGNIMKTFEFRLADIQPSQLYINSDKWTSIKSIINSGNSISPIPVKELLSKVVLTDGHTRALAAYQRGDRKIQVYWDTDQLDWESYEICVKWCIKENVLSIADLESRIISAGEYQRLWIDRCREMHEQINHFNAQHHNSDNQNTALPSPDI